jgi:hypothetical protein
VAVAIQQIGHLDVTMQKSVPVHVLDGTQQLHEYALGLGHRKGFRAMLHHGVDVVVAVLEYQEHFVLQPRSHAAQIHDVRMLQPHQRPDFPNPGVWKLQISSRTQPRMYALVMPASKSSLVRVQAHTHAF